MICLKNEKSYIHTFYDTNGWFSGYFKLSVDGNEIKKVDFNFYENETTLCSKNDDCQKTYDVCNIGICQFDTKECIYECQI